MYIHCKVILKEITLNEKKWNHLKARHYGTQVALYVHEHLK